MATDPQAKWRELPEPVHPDGYVTEQDIDPVPGSVLFEPQPEVEPELRYAGF